MKYNKTMFLHKNPYNGNDELYPFSMVGSGNYILLGEVEVEYEFDMPSDIEIRDIKVANIKCKIQKTKDDAAITVDLLLGEIQKLMAIES